MAKFAIYNYNFLRIIEPNEQMRMPFPMSPRVNVEESFKNRQQLLRELLLADFEHPYQLENAKGTPYWHRQIVKPQDDVYVMRIAHVSNVTITDANLKETDFDDYRNYLVIIDNRPGIQRIAIEHKPKVFKTSKPVSLILETTLCKLLKQKMLKVKLSAVYGTNVFWTTVKGHPEGFKKVSFHFPHLNLERLTNAMDKYLTTAREDWDSDLDFSFGANEGGTVKIDPKNERQRALVEGASGAGTYIRMVPNGKRNPIYCGKNEYVMQEIDSDVFDQLTSREQTIPGMGMTAMDKVKIFMKNIPDVFTSETGE